MPLKLRIVEEALSATFHGANVLALTMSHEMLTQRRRVLENFTATKNVASVNL